MRNIGKYLEIAENNGWSVSVEEFEDGHSIDIDFSLTTSAGQDFHMNISIDEDIPDQLMHQIYCYWENFDPEEEAMIWIDPATGKGGNGAPSSIIDIVKDMAEAKDEIYELWDLMKNHISDRRDTKAFDKLYKLALDELIWLEHDYIAPITSRLIKKYDLKDNYYGNCYILSGRKRIEVESIFTDGDYAMIHVSFDAFEADVNIVNLSENNIKRVMKFLRNVYTNKLKENNYK